MRFSQIKRPALSAVAFFGTLGILSVGYSAYVSNYPATATAGVTQLSATEWNKMVTALQALDTNLSAFTISWGNVGLGVAPDTKLRVDWAIKSTGNVAGVQFGDRVSGNGFQWWSSGGIARLFDQTSGTDRLSVAANGNVGIGTTSPAEKLDVVGTVKTSAGVAFPDGNTQTKAFQGIMTIRQNNVWSFTLAHAASVTHTANCQAGEIATGGGCQDGGYKDFYFWQPGTNSYSCGWYNTSGGPRDYAWAVVFVNCLK